MPKLWKITKNSIAIDVYGWLNDNDGASVTDVLNHFSDYREAKVLRELHLLQTRGFIEKMFGEDNVARFYTISPYKY